MNTPPKTCATCWHFNPQPVPDPPYEDIVGCGNDRHFVTSIDPVTQNWLTYRHVIASDEACPDYLTEQEGDEEQAASWAEHDANQLREEAEQLRQDTKRNELHHEEASAEQVMHQILGRLRKG